MVVLDAVINDLQIQENMNISSKFIFPDALQNMANDKLLNTETSCFTFNCIKLHNEKGLFLNHAKIIKFLPSLLLM